MAEYINKEKLIKRLEVSPLFLNIKPSGSFVCDGVIDIVNKQPAADVVEVVHGEWVWGKVCSSKGYCCTNCGAGFVGENAEWIAKEHDYCPKCGAKMDGERSESV